MPMTVRLPVIHPRVRRPCGADWSLDAFGACWPPAGLDSRSHVYPTHDLTVVRTGIERAGHHQLHDRRRPAHPPVASLRGDRVREPGPGVSRDRDDHVPLALGSMPPATSRRTRTPIRTTATTTARRRSRSAGSDPCTYDRRQDRMWSYGGPITRPARPSPRGRRMPFGVPDAPCSVL
jgi:hypothetical protein